jgi:hypothetical protein
VPKALTKEHVLRLLFTTPFPHSPLSTVTTSSLDRYKTPHPPKQFFTSNFSFSALCTKALEALTEVIVTNEESASVRMYSMLPLSPRLSLQNRIETLSSVSQTPPNFLDNKNSIKPPYFFPLPALSSYDIQYPNHYNSSINGPDAGGTSIN